MVDVEVIVDIINIPKLLHFALAAAPVDGQVHFFVVDAVDQRQLDVKGLVLLLDIGQVGQIEFDDMEIDALVIPAVLFPEVVLDVAEVGQLDLLVEVEGVADFFLEVEDAEAQEAAVAEHDVELALGVVDRGAEAALKKRGAGLLAAEDGAVAAEGIS